jgi:hypothetical protein
MAEEIKDKGQAGSQEDTQSSGGLTLEQAQAKIAELERKTAGLLKEVQSERGKRQEVSKLLEEFEAVKEERDYLKGQIDALEKPDEGNELAEDDVVTVRQLTQKLKQVEDKFSSALEQRDKDILAYKLYLSEKEAKARYKDMPEGLTYEAVAEKAMQMAEEDDALRIAIVQAKDPAERAYQIGLTHPDIRKRMDELKNQELAEKIKNPQATIATGTGSKKTKSDYSTLEILNMPEAQRKKLLEEV